MSEFVVDGPSLERPRFWPLSPDLLYCLLTMALLALVLSFSGAFDTDHMPFPLRTTLWLVVVALIVAQVTGFEALLRRCLPRSMRNELVAGFVAITVTILLMTVELHVLKYTPLLPKQPDPWIAFLVFIAPPVAIIASIVLLIRRPLRQRHLISLASDEPPAAQPSHSTALKQSGSADMVVDERWPSTTILRVSVQDHYLDILTTNGRHIIRGTMKDVVLRLRGAVGLQVHRSHWIAKEHISRIRRRGRDYVLYLNDGTAISVGRSRVTSLREAGWL